MQAVILAGGLGTRLAPFTNDDPKPMYPIEGKPFIGYLMDQLAEWGISRVLLLLGYKAEKIIEYISNEYDSGIEVLWDVTSVEYDTGERLYAAYEKKLINEDFLLMYCDNYCPIDYKKAFKQFENGNSLIQITAYANKDGYTRNNLKISGNRVVNYDKQRKAADLAGVDIGYAFIKHTVLGQLKEVIKERNTIEESEKKYVNFEATVYPKLVKMGQMSAYITEHRYYSIGSWERIELTKEFFKDRKVIFLDRDGTLNVRPPKACYVESAAEFVWLQGAREAVALLKEHGYEIYLFTNQPGVARGRLSEETLNRVHDKMQQDLKVVGACIDGIYCCLHNWDEGCDCRKPKPGLLFQAQKEHSINLTKAVVIGDDDRDIEAGNEAGCRSIKVDGSYSLLDAVNELINHD